MKKWQTLSRVPLSEGVLELRQRGDDEFLIVIGGRVLMTSIARHSEEALAKLACAPLAKHRSPRILIGGLGMGFTLRTALHALPKSAEVVVAELNREVVDWCRGPLAKLTGDAVSDPRVRIEIADVSRVIAAAAPREYDAILLDLYEGPHAATQRPGDPFYGRGALLRTFNALAPQGIFAVWSEDPDSAFAQRLSDAGFAVSRHREGQGGRVHFVYLGEREPAGLRPSPRDKPPGRPQGKPNDKRIDKGAESGLAKRGRPGKVAAHRQAPAAATTWPKRAADRRTSRRDSPRPT